MKQATIGKKADPHGEHLVPAEPARDRLIRAASSLFCRFGINATGVDAVVEAAGTAKATLYKAFGSKERLVEAVLDAEGEAWRNWFLAALDRLPGGPRDKLAGMFDILEEWFATDRFFGCPFLNAVGEFDKRDARYKELALAHKRAIMKRIADLAKTAGCADPEAVALQLCFLADGAITAALLTGDAKVARVARAAAVKVIAAA
jgi:AcrR family transcriptional regulator